MYYLVVLKTLSSGATEQTITKYENKDVCLRKFHEAFNIIGGGPKKISAIVLNDTEGQYLDMTGVTHSISQVSVEKNETWAEEVTSKPEE